MNRGFKKELEAILRNIPSGVCVYRLDDDRIFPVYHNPAFYEILGYSKEHISQVENQMPLSGVHPEDMPDLEKKFEELKKEGIRLHHTFRVYNDAEAQYRHIHIDGSMKREDDGTRLIHTVYSDVSQQVWLEKELTSANEKMQDIINAIPGGVAIYKVSDIFETIYFSDGVPELSGYTVEEYQEMIKRDAAGLTYKEDTQNVVDKAMEVVRTRGIAEIEFRKMHREGYIVWVRARMKYVGEEDGCPLIHCVFHNISNLKETELELSHLVNSIPGGIASYRIEGDRFIPTFFSDGVMKLSGHSREEYQEMVHDNVLDIIYEPDRDRVLAAAKAAVISGEVLDVSYRMRHKDGNLIWIHLNGRRMGPVSETTRFYAVFTGMSAETRLFQSLANETADGIYVIERENYELLYVNESKELFKDCKDGVGKKCYEALQGRSEPCDFCTLRTMSPDGEESEMWVEEKGEYYKTRFKETEWNGIPAYIKYVRDVTQEVEMRKEKERLEQYFQTLVRHLPGGVAVVRYEKDGAMVPEFISDGFAAMTEMDMEDAWELYSSDAMAGVHPEDKERVRKAMEKYIAGCDSSYEIVYRIKKGEDGYLWVKNTLSLIQNQGGDHRVYAVYHDMTEEIEAQERMRSQYKDLIIRHYRAPGPNALVLGHCNITRNRILEIIDYTDSSLLEVFGEEREKFFTGLSGLIVEAKDQRKFLETYLNEPSLAAFERKDTEQILQCFVKLPKEEQGRYVQFKMNLLETPDTGDVTGVLTVTDITEQIISDRIMHRLSVTDYDFVVDVDLHHDTYNILSSSGKVCCAPPSHGSHTQWVSQMVHTRIVPKDRQQYQACLEPGYIMDRLKKERSYTFGFSIMDENGNIWAKNLTVSAIDLRLGRVCLSRTDITESIQEQQGLLHMIAYTFELAGFINIRSEQFIMYTRQTVLENLSPYILEQYSKAVDGFTKLYGVENKEEARQQFELKNMIRRLEEKPEGYDFVLPYQEEDQICYKQINVLWGDQNHSTICLVRADVTDMLASEREAKHELENALNMAQEASRAKSEFLSAMSHDIRTPMNAIVGMTTLANANIHDMERVKDCLKKIETSSRHLLSLVNDILDMSKIENSKITINHMAIHMPGLIGQLAAIIEPQAKDAGIKFEIQSRISHKNFYGDSLRISQILINILSNAVKFTPSGGTVGFAVEESPAKQGAQWTCYRFTVTDTGIGMTQEFQQSLFEPFMRSHAAEKVEGTGLGLSITKGLVDLMGGRLTVESQVSKGSVFQVELECEIMPEEWQNSLESEILCPKREKELAGKRFLVVEDNDINAEILCELLGMFGAESVLRMDGRQAVQAFEEAPPGEYDAILMDIQMPVMNGYEASAHIRQTDRPDARSIPIVAMTANAFAEDVQASLEAGMTAHVAKPIDIDILRMTLHKVLDREE